MRRVLLALLGLVLLAWLSLFCFKSKASSIKENLISKANSALNSHNITWAKTDLVGNGVRLTNIVKLSGQAPTVEAKSQAAKIVSSIEGVGGVKNDLEISMKEDNSNDIKRVQKEQNETDSSISSEKEKQDKPKIAKKDDDYKLYMVKNAKGKLFLEGYLPSKKAHETLLKKAKELFGKDQIEDSIKIQENAPKDWNDMSQFGLERLADVDYGDMNISGYGYLFKGHLSSNEKKIEFLNSIKEVMADPKNHYGRYRGDYIVTAPIKVQKEEPKIAKEDKAQKAEDIKNKKRSNATINKQIKVPTEEKVNVKKVAKVAKHNDECQTILDKTIVSRHINFAYNSTRITDSSYAILDDIINSLNRCNLNGKVLEIAGHTDSRGSRNYNQFLSQRRSEKIKSYFIKHGINAANLRAVGYGESMPIADNKTAAGRALNRRTEFKIISK